MVPKTKEKMLAIKLRKQGKTYGEIIDMVGVSRSTVSLWLRSAGLAAVQHQRITDKRRDAQRRGAAVRREMRLASTREIYTAAIQDVSGLTPREFWLCGVMLYWAEGCKEKENKTGQGVDFGNTDPHMITFFVRWLQEVLKVSAENMNFSLYIHENNKYRLKEVEKYWMQVLDIKGAKIAYTCFKKHNPKTVRHNVEPDRYWGTLRVRVAKSTNLQRKIQGWVYGITGVPGNAE